MIEVFRQGACRTTSRSMRHPNTSRTHLLSRSTSSPRRAASSSTMPGSTMETARVMVQEKSARGEAVVISYKLNKHRKVLRLVESMGYLPTGKRLRFGWDHNIRNSSYFLSKLSLPNPNPDRLTLSVTDNQLVSRMKNSPGCPRETTSRPSSHPPDLDRPMIQPRVR